MPGHYKNAKRVTVIPMGLVITCGLRIKGLSGKMKIN